MSDVPRWRRIVGTILLVVGCVLVPLSLSAVWVRNTLLDTDNYVSTVGPLASDPHVQQAVANRVTDALVNDANVEKKIAAALPPRASFLAAPLEDGVRSAVDRAALRLAQSSRFETLWERVNRRAHAALVKVLTGGGSRVSTENGTVAVNVEQIVENVKQRLDAKGITVLDNVQVPPRQATARDRAVEGPRAGPRVGQFPPEDRLVHPAHRPRVLRRGDRPVREPAPHHPARRPRRRVRGGRPAGAAQGRTQPVPRCGDHQEVDAGRRRFSVGPAHELPPHVRAHDDRARAGDRLRGLGRRALVRGHERARLVAPHASGRREAPAPRRRGPLPASWPAPRRCCAASASRSPSWC